jgi:hypothetical protein
MPRNHLRNLFLVGQSIGHPGVLGTAVSGMMVAGAMTGEGFGIAAGRELDGAVPIGKLATVRTRP